jgi:Domain of unknown function (DUF3883)
MADLSQDTEPPPDDPDEGETEFRRRVKYPHDETATMREGERRDATDGRTRGERENTPGGRPRQTDRRGNRERQNPDQNREVERAAMAHVKRELTQLWPGCEIHDVSAKRDYGHDYLVRWGGKGLRIEVKGHSGDHTRVVLTPTELRESRRTDSRYPWELWNVTNLASNKRVTIERFSSVPEDAILHETGVRVDLARCVRVAAKRGDR